MEVSGIPEKTDSMRQTNFWIILLLATLLAACSGQKKALKSGNPEEAAAAAVVAEDEKKARFEELFIEALKQKMVGNPQKAVLYLNSCLEMDPRSSAAMYELANLHLMNNDLVSAASLLEKAIAISPQNKWYKLLLARIYQQTDKSMEAAALYEQLSALEPNNPEYLFLEAQEQAKAKKYDEAIKTLNELEKKTGINEQVSTAKQEVFVEAGKIKEAFAEINRLIASNPADPRYVGLLADLYKDQGDKENALKNYLKILKMDPENGFVNFSLSDFYLEQGDTLRAVDYLLNGFANEEVDTDTKLQLYLLYTGENTKLNLKPEQTEQLIDVLIRNNTEDPRVYTVYAEYLIRNKRPKEAREQLLKVTASGENDFAIWEQILYIDNDLLDWQALYDHGKMALERFPNHAMVYFLQAVGALQLNKYAEAISLADEGLNYVVDNKALEGQFVFLKGEAKYKLKQLQEAFQLFDRAVELDPENYIALNNYAYYLSLAEKDLEKAERMSGRVIEKFPDNATYLDTYAWVLFKKKNYTLAKFYMETALSHSEEESSTLVEHYGDILFMLNDTAGALKNWEKALEMGNDSSVLKQKIAEKKYIREE